MMMLWLNFGHSDRIVENAISLKEQFIELYIYSSIAEDGMELCSRILILLWQNTFAMK